MMIRDTAPDDFTPILQLNEESVRFLSPLNRERLAQLHEEAAYRRVCEWGDEGERTVVAFLLAFREGCTYDSPNYRWFAARYKTFIYIDRIVVSPTRQGHGIGDVFYTDLFTFARKAKVDWVTCEFDIEPPNEASQRFHERRGFKEVGTQSVANGKKRVSLQAVSLGS